MEILEKARQMLTEHPLCNHCLGRQFAFLGHDIENKSRGITIKLLLTMKGHHLLLTRKAAGVDLLRIVAFHGDFAMARKILKRFKRRAKAQKTCFLCEGHFEQTGALAEAATEKVAKYEFTTFLVGIEIPLGAAEREDEFKAQFNVSYGESMRSQFSRDIGKQFSEMTQKEVSYRKPDIVVLVNPFTNRIKTQVNPLYVAGRYRKLVRGIPQSRWLCGECNGKGCKRCNWTGKKYQESVEELIGIPMLKTTQGKEIAFHGAGREDVDARMLGSGRPFVLEVKKPAKRSIDLQKLEKKINESADGKIKVHKLRFGDKDVVRRCKKSEAAQKLYRVDIEFSRVVSDEELKRIEKLLCNATVHQQTPQRILHRRADLTREKHIYMAKVKRLSSRRARMEVSCQGGLYIKELITGDKGRTEPSVASILGSEASPLQLDVLKVVAGEEK